MLIQIIQLIVEYWVLRVIQFWFNWPVYFLKRFWNNMDAYHTAIDQYQSMKHCQLTRSISYGNHPRERLHLLEPTQTTVRGTIFYVHGGGFVTSCREMYYNSFTYLCRRGYRVLIIDYPLSPQSRHPQPTLSILRCLNMLRCDAKWNVEELHMIGDSAGANLILSATAIVQNKHVRTHFQSYLSQQDQELCRAFRFPRPLCCVSIYGMINRKVGSQHPYCGLGLNFLWQCIANYEQNDSALFPVSFADVISIEQFQKLKFPPTSFVVGDGDPLLRDSLEVERTMALMQYETEIHVFKGGFHGFFGVPPDWQLGCWKYAAKPCSETVYDFLDGHTKKKRNMAIPLLGKRTIGNDFFGVIVISQLVIVMPLVIIGVPLSLLWLLWRTIL